MHSTSRKLNNVLCNKNCGNQDAAALTPILSISEFIWYTFVPQQLGALIRVNRIKAMMLADFHSNATELLHATSLTQINDSWFLPINRCLY